MSTNMWTHATRYPGGMVAAFNVKPCLDCGKPMAYDVAHLSDNRIPRDSGMKVLRKPLPEEGGEDGYCELCSTY